MKKFLLLSLVALSAEAWTHRGANIYGWNTDTLTFYVNYTNCTMDAASLNAVIDSALKAWNGVPGSDLKLVRSTETSTVTPAEMLTMSTSQTPVIACADDMTSYGDADQIPGFSPNLGTDSEGHVSYSGLVLNAQVGAAAEISQFSSGQLALIIAHEIGHVLGLGHSSEPEALMYYSLGSKTIPLLTLDDQEGVVHLYPRNEFSGGMYGCSAVHAAETDYSQGAAILFFTVLGLLTLVVFGRRYQT